MRSLVLTTCLIIWAWPTGFQTHDVSNLSPFPLTTWNENSDKIKCQMLTWCGQEEPWRTFGTAIVIPER